MRLPTIHLDRSDLVDVAAALSREWLLPNGLGGYAASTVLGTNTAARHGLLVVNVPGLGPAVILAKLEETARIGERDYSLSTNVYPDVLYPTGHENAVAFDLAGGSVTFTYRAGQRTVRKTVFCRHGTNAAAVIYRADGPVGLEVRPMFACRLLDERTAEDSALGPTLGGKPADDPLRGLAVVGDEPAKPGVLTLRSRGDLPAAYLAHNAAEVDPEAYWYKNVCYPVETALGCADREDLLSPCGLRFELDADRPACLVASTEALDALPDVAAWLREEEARVGGLTAAVEDTDKHLARLTAAADAFLVNGSGASRPAIVAGYPACGERGRDTFIALPGLTLVTGRFDEAREILRRYAALLQEGAVPGGVAEGGGPPAPAAMDVGLWFVYAVGEYWRYTQDAATVREVLVPASSAVVKQYLDGSAAGCKADADGLLRAGSNGAALTRMDGLDDGRSAPPRAGKPVEVQALWYNALRTLDWLESSLNGKRLTQYAGLADIARASFLSQFWNYRSSSLHDAVAPGGHDARLRPNQILAASLPFTMLNGQQLRGVVDAVQRHLLTPLGLRTLAPSDPDYLASAGAAAASLPSVASRGAAWAWLMGPFVTAYLRAYGRTANTVRGCREMLAPLLERMASSECLGHVGEWLAPGSVEPLSVAAATEDAGPLASAIGLSAALPAGGAVASAAATAELLRALWEDVLGRRGRAMTQPEVAERTRRPQRLSRRSRWR